MKKISVIIPVYNEEAIVGELMGRVSDSVKAFPYDFEFILVDDGSADNTLRVLMGIQERDPRLKILKLSRNWGHQNAYNAGVDYANSDAVILMDGDLEDPPELIGEFLKKWEEGFCIVYAVKRSRQDNKFKKLMISIFYRLMERFSRVHIDRQVGMFSLLDKKVLRELKRFKEKNKYYVGLMSFVGFNRAAVYYDREKRFAGRPKQTFFKLINYGLDAFFSFSFFPIRLLTYFGIFILAIIMIFTSLLIIVKAFGLHFLVFQDLPDWTSIALINLGILGVLIIFMGILGEYIARIFDEVKNRPYYILEDIIEPANPGLKKDTNTKI